MPPRQSLRSLALILATVGCCALNPAAASPWQSADVTVHRLCGEAPAGWRNYFRVSANNGLPDIVAKAWAGPTMAQLRPTAEGQCFWYHVAVTRQGGTPHVFVNGQRLATSGSMAANLTTATNLVVGANDTYTGSGGNRFNGYFDDVRITVGAARYTASFTAPADSSPAY